MKGAIYMSGTLSYRLKDTVDNNTGSMITAIDIDSEGTPQERMELYIDVDMITRAINTERDRRLNIQDHQINIDQKNRLYTPQTYSQLLVQ